MSVVSSAPESDADDLPHAPPMGTTGPTGEVGLPPSRPSTAATSKTGFTSSKKAPGSAAGSRPPSSYSRTHVPSLTSSAFFRPMSSQRLQAQRGARPMSNLGAGSAAPRSVPGGSESGKENKKPGTATSTRTASTGLGGGLGAMGLRYDDRPVSRATDVTEIPDRNTANASPSGADTLRSAVDSEAPLHQGGSDATPTRHRPTHLDLQGTSGNIAPGKPSPRSPRSFRNSFILPQRNSRNSVPRRQEGHEKLDSDPPTPHTITKDAENREEVKKELGLGRNYEYFTGNTRFFMGGRWQNAREFPINVGTGLLILIPAVLFFVFS